MCRVGPVVRQYCGFRSLICEVIWLLSGLILRWSSGLVVQLLVVSSGAENEDAAFVLSVSVWVLLTDDSGVCGYLTGGLSSINPSDFSNVKWNMLPALFYRLQDKVCTWMIDGIRFQTLRLENKSHFSALRILGKKRV